MSIINRSTIPKVDLREDPNRSVCRRIQVVILTGILGLLVVSCGSLQRNPVPVDQMDAAAVPDMPHVRSWGNQFSAHFQEDIVQSVRDEPSGAFPRHPDGALAYSALTLSGGGSDGAFGAGILNGWTESGNRPDFKIVTGISTGALIAPFAFLGPEYDAVLKDFYTGVTTEDILRLRGNMQGIRGESLADSAPLAALIASLVDAEFLEAIAEAHASGKRLFIGTTHLDADQLVVWNMGAIAASGQPEAAALFRSVMLASASIPGAFPPVYIKVEVNGQTYDEMHVDGGVKTQVFLHGAMLDLAEAARTLGGDEKLEDRSTIYLIRNGKIEPEPKQVRRNTLEIGGRAISSMIQSSAGNDIFRIYTFAKRDGFNFYYAGIPAEVKIESAELFDRDAMKKLYDLGYEMALSGEVWRSELPGR